MDDARPLRDVFADLAGDENARRAHAEDPEGFLSAQGHGDLPDGLVAEAIVSYADTAPPEVAEHLAPFVMAHSAVPLDADDDTGLDPADGLDLLATVPAAPEPDDLPDDVLGDMDLGGGGPAALVVDHHDEGGTADDLDLGFGQGDTGDDAASAAAGLDGDAGDLGSDLEGDVSGDAGTAGEALPADAGPAGPDLDADMGGDLDANLDDDLDDLDDLDALDDGDDASGPEPGAGDGLADA